MVHSGRVDAAMLFVLTVFAMRKMCCVPSTRYKESVRIGCHNRLADGSAGRTLVSRVLGRPCTWVRFELCQVIEEGVGVEMPLNEVICL